MDEQIGRRLIALRGVFGISQRELAKRAGVPNSAISVIEQGKSSPSVSSLARVLAGFPLTLEQFFAIAVTPSPTAVRADVALQLFTAAELPGVHFLAGGGRILCTRGHLRLHTCCGVAELTAGQSTRVDGVNFYRVEPVAADSCWIEGQLAWKSADVSSN